MLSQYAYSNAKPLPGYYITLNGDSVRCRIEYSDWVSSPKSIVVWTENTRQIFNVADIKGFGVNGYGDFTSAKVTLHGNTSLTGDLPEEFSDKVESRETFLTVIATGYYSLYVLVLPERAFYFIREADGDVNELVYRVKRLENNIVEDPQYKKTIFALLAKEGVSAQNLESVNRASYNSSDLKRLIGKLNANHGQVSAGNTARMPSRADNIQISIYAGGRYNIFPTAFEGKYAPAGKFSSSFSLTGGINFLYRLPFRFKAIALGASIGYTQYSHAVDRSGTKTFYESANYNSVTTYSEKISLKNQVLLADLYLLYFINPLNNVKFYVKAGISGSISLKHDRDINDTYAASSQVVMNGLPPVEVPDQGATTIASTKSIVGIFTGGLGSTFDRHKFELNYFLPSQLSSGKIDFKISGLGLYYYYTIRK